MRELPLILPDWPAPPKVRAAVTTRVGGGSQGPWASLNLGAHTGDDPDVVAANRRRLAARLGLAREPAWLQQVHGTRVADLRFMSGPMEADASWSEIPGAACAVLTADCLPVLICDSQGTRVAAVHGGWRGLAGGILENTINALGVAPSRLLAWLGPAIGPRAFEVGPEVRRAFVARWPETETAFTPGQGDRLMCDIYAVARLQLQALSVDRVFGGDFCTYHDSERFYSYRRDGAQTGRMASLIWLDAGTVAE